MELVKGFSKRYGIHHLVWYEVHEIMESAMQREKQLKNWSRRAKITLLEKTNPDWHDLMVGFDLRFFSCVMICHPWQL